MRSNGVLRRCRMVNGDPAVPSTCVDGREVVEIKGRRWSIEMVQYATKFG